MVVVKPGFPSRASEVLGAGPLLAASAGAGVGTLWEMLSCQTKLSAKRVVQSCCSSWRNHRLEDCLIEPTRLLGSAAAASSSSVASCRRSRDLAKCGSWKGASRAIRHGRVRSVMGGGGASDESGRDVENGASAFVREVVLPDGQDSDAGPRGAIHIILGPMFAGKTTALLSRMQKEIDAGRSVALAKSDKDARYAVSAVVSHDGAQLPCYAVPDLETLKLRLGEEQYSKLEVIGIDEAQFFPDLLPFCQAAADAGKTVVVAGLDGDFQRQPFGKVLNLITLADTVTKLAARCELCGQPASFSFRKVDGTQRVVIGGAEIYMPVCRRHYVIGQVAMEAARSVMHSQSVGYDKEESQAQSQHEPVKVL